MSFREGTSRKVSFVTRDKLGDKIDKLTVMLGRLAAKDSDEKRPFKPEIYQSIGRGQNRGYGQRNYHNRNRLSNRSISRDRGQFRRERGRPRFEQGIEAAISKIILEDIIDKTVEGNIDMIIIGVMAIREVGIGPERDCSQETVVVTELEVQAIVDQDQDPEPVLTGIE